MKGWFPKTMLNYQRVSGKYDDRTVAEHTKIIKGFVDSGFDTTSKDSIDQIYQSINGKIELGYSPTKIAPKIPHRKIIRVMKLETKEETTNQSLSPKINLDLPQKICHEKQP